jgi:hypothetical protein
VGSQVAKFSSLAALWARQLRLGLARGHATLRQRPGRPPWSHVVTIAGCRDAIVGGLACIGNGEAIDRR